MQHGSSHRVPLDVYEYQYTTICNIGTRSIGTCIFQLITQSIVITYITYTMFLLRLSMCCIVTLVSCILDWHSVTSEHVSFILLLDHNYTTLNITIHHSSEYQHIRTFLHHTSFLLILSQVTLEHHAPSLVTLEYYVLLTVTLEHRCNVYCSS